MRNDVGNAGKDPFIMAVLDQIFESHQIDSACLRPDYKLGSDLGLSRVQIQLVLKGAVEKLGLQVPFENCRIEDASARELVNLLRHWATRAGHQAA